MEVVAAVAVAQAVTAMELPDVQVQVLPGKDTEAEIMGGNIIPAAAAVPVEPEQMELTRQMVVRVSHVQYSAQITTGVVAAAAPVIV
jgi:hypothetical protein